MTRTIRSLLVVGLSLMAMPAFADELPRYQLREPALVQLDEGGGEGVRGTGSLLSGRTVGAGADAIHAQFGWPGIFISYLHGAASNVDVGGTFGFVYGVEGMPRWTDPGLKMAGLIRLNLMDNGKINVGLRFDPGITMYFSNDFYFGLATPIALVLGVEAGDAIMINFGIDMPMTIFFTPDVFFSLPILTGVGLEYHVDPKLSITLNTGFGPDILTGSGRSHTEFAFKTLAGIGYRF